MRATSVWSRALASVVLVVATTAASTADDDPPAAPGGAPTPPATDADHATTDAPAPAAAKSSRTSASPTLPAPVDIAAFPPRSVEPEPRPLGVELHGFLATWWIPWSEEGPSAASDALRLRFAVLRVDARPAPKVSVIGRLGLMLPDSPLLDLAATYQPHEAIGLTFGQFRLPLGAAATTLAPQLVMLDRPRYVYAMTKLAFRDVGAMVHSGPAGLLDGMVHYRLAVASGSGRLGSGISRPPAATEYLVAGRVLVDAGRFLVVGLSYARSRDPAIDTGVIANDRALAANTLGRTLVPFGDKRVTHLAGADVTFSRGPIWAQAETMYLRSHATVGDAHASSLGVSLEAGYTLPVRLPIVLQLAVRGERFDPNRDLVADTQHIGSFGLNATTARLRWSAFVSVTRFEDVMTGDPRHAGELAVRAAATF
ncbi:MAG: hypothetical protein AB7T06_12045 [Kofleriaceae bacterium]